MGKRSGAQAGNKNAAKSTIAKNKLSTFKPVQMAGARKPGLAGLLGIKGLSPVARKYGDALRLKTGANTAIITQAGLNRFASTGKV
jgi:hypothetical protein